MAVAKSGHQGTLTGYGDKYQAGKPMAPQQNSPDQIVAAKYIEPKTAARQFDDLKSVKIDDKEDQFRKDVYKMAVEEIQMEFNKADGKNKEFRAPLFALKYFLKLKEKYQEVTARLDYRLTVVRQPDVWSLELCYENKTLCAFISTSKQPFKAALLGFLQKLDAKYRLYQACSNRFDDGRKLSYETFTELFLPVTESTKGDSGIKNATAMAMTSVKIAERLPTKARQLITVKLLDAVPTAGTASPVGSQAKMLQLVVNGIIIDEQLFDPNEPTGSEQVREVRLKTIQNAPDRLQLLKWVKPHTPNALKTINASLTQIDQAQSLSDVVEAMNALTAIMAPNYKNRFKLAGNLCGSPADLITVKLNIEEIRQKEFNFNLATEGTDGVLMPSKDYLTYLEVISAPTVRIEEEIESKGSKVAGTYIKTATRRGVKYLITGLNNQQDIQPRELEMGVLACQRKMIVKLGENLTIPGVVSSYKAYVAALKKAVKQHQEAEVQKQQQMLKAAEDEALARQQAEQNLQELVNQLETMSNADLLRKGKELISQFDLSSIKNVKNQMLIDSFHHLHTRLAILEDEINTLRDELNGISATISSTSGKDKTELGNQQIATFELKHQEMIKLDDILQFTLATIKDQLKRFEADQKSFEAKQAAAQHSSLPDLELEASIARDTELEESYVKQLMRGIQSKTTAKDHAVRLFATLVSVMEPQHKDRLSFRKYLLDGGKTQGIDLKIDDADFVTLTFSIKDEEDCLQQAIAQLESFNKSWAKRVVTFNDDIYWAQKLCAKLPEPTLHGELGALTVPVKEAIQRIKDYFASVPKDPEASQLKIIDGELSKIIDDLGGHLILHESEIRTLCEKSEIPVFGQQTSWLDVINSVIVQA